MTITQSSSQSAHSSAPTAAQVESACRFPVLFLAFSGGAWLFAGLTLAALASVQLYNPTFLEGCPWVTYGRLRPAAVNALAYGFALQSAFALALWFIARLGRVELSSPLGLAVAAKFWNVGVTVGVLGILAGDASGHDLLEFPLYASLPLIASYVCFAAWALLALHRRAEREMYVSLWFVGAGLLWFPWIFATAQSLLLGWQVTGVVQAVVAGWFGQNLLQIVLTGSALAVLFYFVPKIVNRPLANPGLTRAGFWLLLLIGGWGGLAQLASVPAWIPAVSGAANFLVLVPVASLLVSLWQTVDGKVVEAWRANVTFRFLLVAAGLLLLSVLRTAFLGGQSTQYTFFATARTDIVLLGVFGLSALGALLHIVPRLTTGEDELPSVGLTDLVFWTSLLGVVGVAAGYSLAGLVQADVNMNVTRDFLKDGTVASAGYLKLVTAGYAALTVAALAFLANFGLAVRRCFVACCGGAR